MSKTHVLEDGVDANGVGILFCGKHFDKSTNFSYTWFSTVANGSPYSFDYCYRCLVNVRTRLQSGPGKVPKKIQWQLKEVEQQIQNTKSKMKKDYK